MHLRDLRRRPVAFRLHNPAGMTKVILLALLAGCMVGDTADGESDTSYTANSTVLRTVDRRFEIIPLDCTVSEQAATPQCPPSDARCLCSSLFDHLNQPAGTPGNPQGKIIVT